jgi:hypothetical protein
MALKHDYNGDLCVEWAGFLITIIVSNVWNHRDKQINKLHKYIRPRCTITSRQYVTFIGQLWKQEKTDRAYVCVQFNQNHTYMHRVKRYSGSYFKLQNDLESWGITPMYLGAYSRIPATLLEWTAMPGCTSIKASLGLRRSSSLKMNYSGHTSCLISIQITGVLNT